MATRDAAAAYIEDTYVHDLQYSNDNIIFPHTVGLKTRLTEPWKLERPVRRCNNLPSLNTPFAVSPKRGFLRSHFRTSSSDIDCISTFSLGSSVPTLRRFCRLRTVIWYEYLFKSPTPGFLARDSIYAIARYMPSPVRPSVRPSVTRVDQSKTVEVRITQPSPQSSPMTQVSWRSTTP